jgi:hypothetical protein
MPMEAKDIFEATSRNVRELLSEKGLGLYIPPYQRPYGWDKEKVAKLLDDTLHGYMLLIDNEESFSFLGTIITIHDINFTTVQPIVRPDVPSKVLTVIDGQQRMTSLLLLCLALHNQIRLSHSKMLKGRTQDQLTTSEQWLDGQSLRIIEELSSTFQEKQAYGDASPYPRMIRSFDDQWARTTAHAKYHSPIAQLISKYTVVFAEKPVEYKPKPRENVEGEVALIERLTQVSKTLKAILAGNSKQELEELPSLEQIQDNKKFQRALLNHDFPEEVSQSIKDKTVNADFSGLLHLILFSSYLLNRVALTVVRGKNEDYAFTVFESLNTTGEPLTAFETFKPKVVSAETLEKYEHSPSRKLLDEVSNYLSESKVGEPLQAATRDLLIFFAAAETGAKLSKRLADQRRYLKEEFERHEQNSSHRLAFVENLRNVATFRRYSWDRDDSTSLHGLPVEATTDSVKLCLGFLAALGHSVTIAPLVRFYSNALAGSGTELVCKEFEGAIKAMTAFSVLWRASRRNTGNIDQEYRELLTGDNNLTELAPLARTPRKDKPTTGKSQVINLTLLKAELKARLADKNHGAIADRSQFIKDAQSLPAYTISKTLARFLLLAAYHDAVEDQEFSGLVTKGRSAVSPCLTFNGFQDDRLLSLEHIAPQSVSGGWPIDIWSNKETIHKLGNLVLVHRDANSSFSNRPWDAKRTLYAALSAPSHLEAEKILSASDIEFGGRAQEIAKYSAHMPHLSALGRKSGDWSTAFIENRTVRLLELAWDQLYAWID